MYKDIAEYGLIGDMHSAALVSRDGSIDYCSMPHLDSPTVFASLLDDEKGGNFHIHPREEFTAEQSYIHHTGKGVTPRKRGHTYLTHSKAHTGKGVTPIF